MNFIIAMHSKVITKKTEKLKKTNKIIRTKKVFRCHIRFNEFSIFLLIGNIASNRILYYCKIKIPDETLVAIFYRTEILLYSTEHNAKKNCGLCSFDCKKRKKKRLTYSEDIYLYKNKVKTLLIFTLSRILPHDFFLLTLANTF